MKLTRKYSLLNWMGCLMIAVALAAACALFSKALLYDELPKSIIDQFHQLEVAINVVTWSNLSDLKAKIEEKIDLQKRLDVLRGSVDPGPEPSWFWHPLDHYWWIKQKQSYDTIQSELCNLKQRLNTLEFELRELGSDQEKVLQLIDSVSHLRVFWNRFAAPILHLLLAFALFRYGLSLMFRILLINGFISQTRL